MEFHGDSLVIAWEVNIRITGNTSFLHKEGRRELTERGRK
jgi:hypothetical protein